MTMGPPPPAPPDGMTMKAWVEKDREHVVLQMEKKDGPALAHMLFDSTALDKHISDLAKHRAQLNEPVPPDLDPGSRFEAIVDPAWKVDGVRLAAGRVLLLRHPGLGWLSLVLPDKEAASIAEWMTKDLPLRPGRE
jgi:hypothetical protein